MLHHTLVLQCRDASLPLTVTVTGIATLGSCWERDSTWMLYMPGGVEIMREVEEEEEVRENDGVELAITVIRYPLLGGGRGVAQETCTASRATCWAFTLLGGSPVHRAIL